MNKIEETNANFEEWKQKFAEWDRKGMWYSPSLVESIVFSYMKESVDALREECQNDFMDKIEDRLDEKK